MSNINNEIPQATNEEIKRAVGIMLEEQFQDHSITSTDATKEGKTMNNNDTTYDTAIDLFATAKVGDIVYSLQKWASEDEECNTPIADFNDKENALAAMACEEAAHPTEIYEVDVARVTDCQEHCVGFGNTTQVVACTPHGRLIVKGYWYDRGPRTIGKLTLEEDINVVKAANHILDDAAIFDKKYNPELTKEKILEKFRANKTVTITIPTGYIVDGGNEIMWRDYKFVTE